MAFFHFVPKHALCEWLTLFFVESFIFYISVLVLVFLLCGKICLEISIHIQVFGIIIFLNLRFFFDFFVFVFAISTIDEPTTKESCVLRFCRSCY
jgi:uncharacterized membrane protein